MTVSFQVRILASELRRLRELAGHTQSQAEEAAGLTAGSLSRYETCTSAIAVPAAQLLLRDVYGVRGDRLDDLLELARVGRRRRPKGSGPGVLWPPVEDLAILERDASTMQTLALVLVPGVLQTEDYARAILGAGRLGADVEKHVQARLGRAEAVFNRSDPPEYWAILRESVLRCHVGGRDVMAQQLDHLAAVADRPRCMIQIIPDSHGAHPSMTTAYVLLSFSLAPDFKVAYLDYPTGSLYIDQQPEVGTYAGMYPHLVAAALPPAESLALIHRTREELYT
ncbi:helix-turn-helix transcriptional regulator [Longispora sp. NPDC051575]|uniref:helix-turn-helix domain-containing protein n=1 Tax=Longispora sp. NPDC051575 TaxID=3154943 RepID=UPI00342C43FF